MSTNEVLNRQVYKRPEVTMHGDIGGSGNIELSKNYHVTHYLCKLTVTHDNGANPVFGDNELYSIINKLEIIGNGNQNFKAIDGFKLKLNTVLGHTTQSKKSLDTTADANGVTSHVWFMIPMNLMDTIRPHDTIFNTFPYTSLEMLCSFASESALGSDITATDVSIQVYSSALLNYTRNPQERIKFFKETQLKHPVVNTTTEDTIDLPTKKKYKTITLVATANGVRSDAVIKNIILKSGTNVIVKIPYEALQVENEMQYKPQDSNDLKGVAIIDFTQRGYISDALDTYLKKFKSLELELDVEKVADKTNIMVYTDEIEIIALTEK